MVQIRASASAVVSAPPAAVYSILADYNRGHAVILPREYFVALEVEEGGIGAGTVIRVQMRLMGTTRTFRARVTEPEPGRTLAETDIQSGAVTTFTVAASSDGSGSLVTIATEWATPGIVGLIQRLLVPRLLRRVYAEELRNLAAYVTGASTG